MIPEGITGGSTENNENKTTGIVSGSELETPQTYSGATVSEVTKPISDALENLRQEATKLREDIDKSKEEATKLREDIDKSNKKADELEKDFDRLEIRTDGKSSFVQNLTTGIGIAFLIALGFLIVDYVKLDKNSYRLEKLEQQIKDQEEGKHYFNCLRIKNDYFNLDCVKL